MFSVREIRPNLPVCIRGIPEVGDVHPETRPYCSPVSRRTCRDEDLIMPLREEIISLRVALNKATAQQTKQSAELKQVDDTAATDFGPKLSTDARFHRALSNDSSDLVDRSSQAMNDLSSLMLQLDVADFGEPSFALTSNKAGEEISSNVPRTAQNTEPAEAVVLSATEQKQLVTCFAKKFNPFHQFLDYDEAETKALACVGADDIDLRFRNSALLAVAASCSDTPRLRNLEGHFYSLAGSLALRSISERPSDLVVQGLALLAWIDLKGGTDSKAYNWTDNYRTVRTKPYNYAFRWHKLSQDEKEDLILRSHQALTEFDKNNSACLKINKEYMPGTAVWLQLAYNAALILVHRPLLGEASDTDRRRFSLTVATTAASTISRTLREHLVMDEISAIGPQILEYISIAATIHVLNATSGRSKLGRQSAHGLRTCLYALSSMNSFWANRSQRSIRHIQDLARRWGVIWALPSPYAQQENSETGLSSLQMLGSESTQETNIAPIAHSVSDGTALEDTAQEFWDLVEAADQDWIFDNAHNIEPSFVDFDTLDWWLGGGD
ncbi:hypothetical protein E4T44_00877 [Aureobasidium sp. EXF-8845]|nr:hypothetical protein E4T44_00877 [Aureobasidium sp. EXF-8845]KAI4857678.1 hypothetical protein E4T45_00827 [Aureobasidium sp. EXF-8846]